MPEVQTFANVVVETDKEDTGVIGVFSFACQPRPCSLWAAAEEAMVVNRVGDLFLTLGILSDFLHIQGSTFCYLKRLLET